MAARVDEIKVSTIADHIEAKGMWAGALERVVMPNLMGAIMIKKAEDTEPTEEVSEADVSDTASVTSASKEVKEKFIPEIQIIAIENAHTPAVFKSFDEIGVNVMDRRAYVKFMQVTFDSVQGYCSWFNDGPTIPIEVHAEQSQLMGRPVYLPEICFGIPLAGSNIDKEHSSVKGGTNGLGAKIANAHSVEFKVEACDGKQLYTQIWHGLKNVGLPEIKPVKKTAPYTRVSFLPAYGRRGYKLGANNSLVPQDAADIDAWLRLRTYQAAAYMGPKVSVSYNGVICGTTTAASLAAMLAGGGEHIVLSSPARSKIAPWSAHPWDISVVVSPTTKRRTTTASTMAIVNGVVSNKGTHVEYLRAAITAAVNSRLKAAGAPQCSGPAEALAPARLVMIGAIPGADWSGQRKDELQVGAKEVANWPTLPDAFLKRVGEAIAVHIMKGANTTPAKPVVHDKYRPARYAGKAQRASTRLLAAEGDSAITLLVAGLTQTRGVSTPGAPTLDWNGIISLQGVIVNAKRETTHVGEAEASLAVRSSRLRDNKRLASLADAFGLRYDCRYETAAERATLRYGQLVLCVDQDLDGTGKIAALVLVWINEFWPALLQNGCIGRLMTPLVRAYLRGHPAPRLPEVEAAGSAAGSVAGSAAGSVAGSVVEVGKGGKTKKTKVASPALASAPAGARGVPAVEFFYEEELKAWLAEDPARASQYNIKYYKGLATHDSSEVSRMFTPQNFQQNLYTYTVDDAVAVARSFEVYFGEDPSLRKAVLVTPVEHLDVAMVRTLHAARQIPVGRVQLDIDTKSYKNDAIKRQLPGAVDALNPARRKIIFGAIARFNGEAAARELKVFQLGGYVADKMFYHHGDASLNSTIVYMAQSFAGARRYPLLEGVGQFGSRHGDEAGSARYISVRLGPLTKCLFPAADRWHLPYVFEDGVRAEPQWLAPVVPLAALESGSNISEGWNHKSFARRLDVVLAVAEAYIRGDPELHSVAEALLVAADGTPPTAILDELARLSTKWPLPAETAGYTGRVAEYKGVPHSFGSYSYNAATRTVTISDLPIGEATDKHLKRLMGLITGKEVARKATTTKTKTPAAKATKTDGLHIEAVRDCSTSEKVSIEVQLAPGAYETILANYGDGQIDPIEDALALRTNMRPHLNYYSSRGGVLELPNNESGYLAAILYWAPRRARIYRDRLERALIVAELRALEETQQLRYTAEAAALDLAKQADTAAAEAILLERKYMRLDSPLLHRPEYTSNEELRHLVTAGPGASYDYILDMRSRELVKTAADARQTRLIQLQAEAVRLKAQLAEKPVAGSSVWLAELAEFRELAKKCV